MGWKYHKTQKGNKYNNRKVFVDGVQFDSVKEGRRFRELKLMQDAGIIENLRRQVIYTLIPSQVICDRHTGKNIRTYRSVTYRADFVYKDNSNGKTVVEDVKGYKGGTAYALFKIKKKLMLYFHQIEVIEV